MHVDAAGDVIAATGPSADDSTFDLEVEFNGMLSNDEDMRPTLWLVDETDTREARDATVTEAGVTTIRAHDADGNRLPAPMGDVSGDTVVWEDIEFPDTWGDSDTETFTIAMVYIDASTVGDDRLEATIEMDASTLEGDNVLTSDPGPVSVARVDQALNLSFDPDDKATFNACEPGDGDGPISVTLEEGFRTAWMPANDILLTTSSGKISADDAGIFDVTGEGGDDELIIDVTPTPSTDTADLAITFEPAAGGTVGDDIVLSAMILPERGGVLLNRSRCRRRSWSAPMAPARVTPWCSRSSRT